MTDAQPVGETGEHQSRADLLPFHDPQLRFRSAPRLETERLVLRPFELRDLDYFTTFFADPQASQFVGGPHGREDAWRRMLAGASLWEITGIGMWAVTQRDDGRAIGHVGFFDFLRGCEPSIAGEAEMGWIFAATAHGRGYALEACGAVLRWFDEHFGSERIWALISPGNDPSMKLAAKLGFVRQSDGCYRGEPATFWLRAA